MQRETGSPTDRKNARGAGRSLGAVIVIAGMLVAAGVAVAQNGPAIPTWEVGASPLVTIGGDSNPQSEFSDITATFRLSDGSLAIVNHATNEIRIFDQRGIFVRAFGRVGAGPGEFRSIGWTGRSADTAFLYDFGLKRVTSVLLGRAPKLLATIVIAATSDRGMTEVAGRLSDRRWLMSTSMTPGWDGPPGVYRLASSVGVVRADGGGAVAWVEKGEGAAVFVHNPTGNLKQAVVGAAAFSPWLYATAIGSTIWIGDSGGDSLLVVGADGKRSALHLPIPRRSPSPATIAASRDHDLSLSRSDKSRGFIVEKYGARVPQILPFFGPLQPGLGGELWVEDFASSPTDAVRYLVLGANGAVRARVTVAPGFRVRDVGTDYLLGVHQDDDGVETVRLYRLSRK